MAATNSTIPLVNYPYGQDLDTFRRIDATIRTNLAAFRKPGVISVRPGYKSVGGYLTRKPAIVVTVANKQDVAPQDALPAKVGDVAVDVRQATPLEKLRAQNPQMYARVVAGGRGEFVLPDPTFERDPKTGEPLAAVLAADALAGPPKKKIDYTPAAGVTLDLVEGPMAITCHASPDAGWPQLKKFFQGIESSLTVGLYDFTSQHVLDGLTNALGNGDRELTLTLDHPPKNPTADQTDEQTVQDLEGALDQRLTFAWALDRSDPKVNTWIFPTAYHIKVAVRDHNAMWLSSGNWNNSNPPDIDPLTDPAGSATIARNSDRDWHIIVEHIGVSNVYEAFLQHDNDVARNPGPAGPQALPAAGVVAPDPDLTELNALLMAGGVTPKHYFAPQRIPDQGTRNIKIQPILTPDNYRAEVLKLIESAETSFYMQTQYIHPSDKAEDQDFADLISAIVDLQRAGKDVRIILSQFEKEGNWLDLLQATRIDLASVRIQTGVHNKGIVVDSKVVMLGSQNWSGDGVLRNRDASLIVFDEDAARYYEQIFLHDWTNMSIPSQ